MLILSQTLIRAAFRSSLFLGEAFCYSKIAMIGYRSLQNARQYPKATILGCIIHSIAGNREPLVVAAQAVLIVRNLLVLLEKIETLKKSIRKVKHCFTDEYSLPYSLLLQKECYHNPHSRKLTFVCNLPEPLGKRILDCERLLRASCEVLTQSLSCGTTLFELATTVFRDPENKMHAVISLPANVCNIYDFLKKNPDILTTTLQAHKDKVHTFLRWTNVDLDVESLCSKIQACCEVANRVSNAVAPVCALLTLFKEAIQVGVFNVIHILTGFRIAPFGLPKPEQNQPCIPDKPDLRQNLLFYENHGRAIDIEMERMILE